MAWIGRSAPVGRASAAGWLAAALLLGTSSWAANALADAAASLPASAAGQLTGLLLLGLSLLCCAAGVWRAAARQRQRTLLAHAGRAAVALVGTGLVIGLGIRHVGDQVLEMARIATGRDPVPAVHVSLGDGGRAMWLRGTLGAGSAERVRQALQDAPALQVIHLDSAGGRVFEAQAIAEEIRRRRLDTYADGLCASACTMLLLAGADRGAADGARIGFHRPQFAGIDDERVVDAHPLLTAYRRAGLGAAFLARVRATRADTMWYPPRSELQALRVLTR